MGWIEGLNDAMDYIEANLEGDLDLAHAARLAACTEGQFRRMFSYIAGIGLGEYVRRRRISRAALDLSRGERVVDVAVRYGYCSPTAFNRAFRDALGISPSEAKRPGAPLSVFPRLSFSLTVTGAEPLPPSPMARDPRGFGAASAMYGIASVVGPVIGGAVAQGLSWHVIFVVNLPISIVALFLSGRCLPGRAPGAPVVGFDVSGSVAASLCVLSLVLAFSLAGSVFPMASPQFVALVVLSVACAALLSRVERGKAAPTVPMGLFRRGQVVAGFVSGFCVQFALMAGVSYLPRLLQEGLGMAAASSGAVLIPMTLALMVGSNTSGAAFRATGRLRAIAAASSAVVLAASVTFSAMSPMLAVASCTAVAAVLGLGVGIGMPVSNLAAQTGADPADAGRATSMAMFFRGFGGTVSTAACGMLAPAATAAGTAGVFGAVCVAAVAGLVASRFIPREIPS